MNWEYELKAFPTPALAQAFLQDKARLGFSLYGVYPLPDGDILIVVVKGR